MQVHSDIIVDRIKTNTQIIKIYIKFVFGKAAVYRCSDASSTLSAKAQAGVAHIECICERCFLQTTMTVTTLGALKVFLAVSAVGGTW
jgi:hypothetical protein